MTVGTIVAGALAVAVVSIIAGAIIGTALIQAIKKKVTEKAKALIEKLNSN